MTESVSGAALAALIAELGPSATTAPPLPLPLPLPLPPAKKTKAVKAARAPSIPAAGGGKYFTDTGAFLTAVLADDVMAQQPCALTQEDNVAVYSAGAYRTDKLALSAAISKLLGNRFQPKHRAATVEYIEGRLYERGVVLPDHADEPTVNVRNGMLDLTTGILKPHDPAYLSAAQLPIDWDPHATCPKYEEWLKDLIPDQIDDLEETISTMLDPSSTPSKAIFCFGASRSGKSTFLRIAGRIGGPANVSAVTLHQLVQNRFAAANVYGKILNSAADISAGHVEDLSIFKMMTGEDPIHADRKYGGQFAFTNRALFAFSANELPTVGESSRAYVERIKPFQWAKSFAGREDPGVERAIMAELPGILARWVRAWQQLTARGHRLATVAAVNREFETRSDRVCQWATERCEITRALSDGRAVTPDTELPAHLVTARRALARAFNVWAESQGGKPMTQGKILDRLTSINGIVDVRTAGDRARGLNVRVLRGDEPDR